jgi:hypothetical protein
MAMHAVLETSPFLFPKTRDSAPTPSRGVPTFLQEFPRPGCHMWANNGSRGRQTRTVLREKYSHGARTAGSSSAARWRLDGVRCVLPRAQVHALTSCRPTHSALARSHLLSPYALCLRTLSPPTHALTSCRPMHSANARSRLLSPYGGVASAVCAPNTRAPERGPLALYIIHEPVHGPALPKNRGSRWRAIPRATPPAPHAPTPCAPLAVRFASRGGVGGDDGRPLRRSTSPASSEALEGPAEAARRRLPRVLALAGRGSRPAALPPPFALQMHVRKARCEYVCTCELLPRCSICRAPWPAALTGCEQCKTPG